MGMKKAGPSMGNGSGSNGGLKTGKSIKTVAIGAPSKKVK